MPKFLSNNMYQKKLLILFSSLLVFSSFHSVGQNDSSIMAGKNRITLKEVIVRNNLDVPAFMKRIKEDTSFYKAFRNLRVLGFSSLNAIQVLNKKNEILASLDSRTRQYRSNGCRWMELIEEKTTGNFYDQDHQFNYYTADLYASLFFTNDTVCGETNIVKGIQFSTKGKSSMEKHKQQLKILFFDPGKKIPGLPFMGNKVALFEEAVAALYDFEIDMNLYNGEMCYLFKLTPRADLSSGERNRIVINEMITWFRIDNWQIIARNYDLSYKTLFYDFDVHMEVEMTQFETYTVPQLIRYNGSWNVPFKKREKAVFTATFFDFNLQDQ